MNRALFCNICLLYGRVKISYDVAILVIVCFRVLFYVCKLKPVVFVLSFIYINYYRRFECALAAALYIVILINIKI